MNHICRQRKKSRNTARPCHPIKTVELSESETELGDVPIDLAHKPGQPHQVDFLLEGKPLCMEVDTGACASLVSKQTFQSLFPNLTLKPLNKCI